MQISLISPLSVQECTALLSEATKKDDIPFSKEYHPPYGEAINNTFNLRVNYGKHTPFLHGKFTETSEGTMVVCEMELPARLKRFNTRWTMIGLPFFSCLVLLSVADGFKDGFSRSSFVMILIGIGLPIFYYSVQKFSERQYELDKQELLDFLKITLAAKLKSS